MRSKFLLLALFSLAYSSLLPAQQPSRIWASYFGYSINYPNVNYPPFATSGTQVTSSVYDPQSGSLYVAGITNDTSGVATPGSFKSHFVVTLGNFGSATYVYADIFLARFDTLGHCLWATYYGGAGAEEYPDITLDANGNVYLCGQTGSDSGIATAGSYRPDFPSGAVVPNGSSCIPFLVKFNSWAIGFGGLISVAIQALFTPPLVIYIR